jgi:hypothetical protein
MLIHVIRGHLWYEDPKTGVRCVTGPQFGQTTFVGEHSNGIFTNEEAPKQSVTDCMGKCALLLGFSADVSLGMFDANKYFNEPGSDASPTPTSKTVTTPKRGTKRSTPASDESGSVAESAESVGEVPEGGPGKSGSKPAAPRKRNRKQMSVEEWSDEILAADEAGLCKLYLEMRSASVREDLAAWERVCTGLADACRKVCRKGSPAWDLLVTGLKDEKVYLASGKASE